MKKNILCKLLIPALCMSVLVFSCKPKNSNYAEVMHNPFLYEKVVHEINYVVIHDIFTPPVASRVFAYSCLASYETLAGEGKQIKSLSGKINGLNVMPLPGKNEKIDYPFAALIALTKVGKALIYSQDRVQRVIDSIKTLASNAGMPDDIYKNSIQYGEQVADTIMAWSKKDNFAQTRGAQFTLSHSEGHWEPTPPGYFEAVEPLWKNIRTMATDSANMFAPPGPVPFSKDTGSAYYKQVMDVYNTVKHLDTTQRWIANFWDCNSFKLHVSGHLMFATKAMTPPGHWMEIAGIICQEKHADFYKTVYAYTGIAIGMFDGFVACWYTKYKYDTERPETFINKYVDHSWMPYLQTPPFPEYNSAHSTQSAAAAVFLGKVFTEPLAFRDSTERDWGWPDRSFVSMDEAAKEVSMSRFYGGIHYRKSVWDAYDQGKKIGAHLYTLMQPQPR